ncbi:MAG: hypothetical protein LBS70_05785 [Candidatus Accumulibacter sp.]|jgi:predicted transcriptional regulator|nr:hypothetical protein [Accumulibacter sp.]
MDRTLTITVSADVRARMTSAMSRAVETGRYQGEYLDFRTPALFFSKLSERRWNIVNALQGAGEVGVRELARRLGRDVKRVHDDAAALAELGLIEKTARGALVCPYADIHVDMHLRKAA